MESFNVLKDLEFHDAMPYAQPLLVNSDVRILRWLLKPGQEIGEHAAPGSPFHVVVLQGRGMFAGADRHEEELGAGALVIFAAGEAHSVRALDEDLVFVGFLQGVEAMRPDHTGGALGRGGQHTAPNSTD